MNKSESIKELAVDLIQAQSELGSIAKNASGHHHQYADLGAHIDVIMPVLNSHGFAVTQHLVGDNDNIGVETMLIHTSGEWLSSWAQIPLQKSGTNSLAQDAGSTISYFRRYALAALVGVYSGDDDDGNATRPTSKKNPVQKESTDTSGCTCGVTNKELPANQHAPDCALRG